jgi:hypothetical protein
MFCSWTVGGMYAGWSSCDENSVAEGQCCREHEYGGIARALGEGARVVCREEHAGIQAGAELITGRRMDILKSRDA